ncbi:MAG: YihY/virulence factor BrkB family protein [Candidatus Eisenbacteria bacterium]
MLERILGLVLRPVIRAFRVIGGAIMSLDRARGLEAAATMAFFALFSLFPLVLLLVVVGGTALKHSMSSEEILETAIRILPVSQDLIRRNIVAILDSRGTVGVVGLIGLLWASTSVFTTLIHNLNRAWPDAPPRGIVHARLTAVLQVVIALVLLSSFLVAQTLLRLPEEWRLTNVGVGLRLPFFASTPSRLIFSLSFFLTLVLLYWWVPKMRVRWREAVGGAVVAAATIHAATSLFIWVLNSGLATYNLVYGSLGALLALLTWAYITSLLLLYGAHVRAAIARTGEGAGKG